MSEKSTQTQCLKSQLKLNVWKVNLNSMSEKSTQTLDFGLTFQTLSLGWLFSHWVWVDFSDIEFGLTFQTLSLGWLFRHWVCVPKLNVWKVNSNLMSEKSTQTKCLKSQPKLNVWKVNPNSMSEKSTQSQCLKSQPYTTKWMNLHLWCRLSTLSLGWLFRHYVRVDFSDIEFRLTFQTLSLGWLFRHPYSIYIVVKANYHSDRHSFANTLFCRNLLTRCQTLIPTGAKMNRKKNSLSAARYNSSPESTVR
jgi:hypothetical protein